MLGVTLRATALFIMVGFWGGLSRADDSFWEQETSYWENTPSRPAPSRVIQERAPLEGYSSKSGTPPRAEDFDLLIWVDQQEDEGARSLDALRHVALLSSWAPAGDVIPYESVNAALSTLAEIDVGQRDEMRFVFLGGRDRFQRFFLESLSPEALRAGATQLGGLLTAEWQWNVGRFSNYMWLSYRAESVLGGVDASLGNALRSAVSELRQTVALGQEARMTLGFLDHIRVEARARLQYEQSPVRSHVYGWIGIALQGE